MTKDRAYEFDFETNTSKIAFVPDPKVEVLDFGICKIRVIVKWVETSWGNATHERQVFLDFSDETDLLGVPYWQPITLASLPQLSRHKTFHHALFRLCDFASGHPLSGLDWQPETEETKKVEVLLGP